MSKSSSARVAKNENRRRLKELMERYGSLLTEKQASMVHAYAIEGLSFSEVARRSGVSRQAVHESVRSAEKVLSDYDEKLGHLAPQQELAPELPPAIVNSPDIGQVVSKLESLKMKIARTGIIYSVDWIRKEIDLVMGMLDQPEESVKGDGAGKNSSAKNRKS